MFVVFQEQYVRVQEYKLQPLISDMDNGLYSFVVYKLHKDERLDDRVVTSDVSTGEIRCDCKWWDTMGILCRHSLTVMQIQATFGYDKFSTLPDAYILFRWTRGVRTAYAYLYVARPLTREEEEEERYVRLHAKFGSIVRAVYRIEELQQFINTIADTLATQVQHALSLYNQRMAPLHASDRVPQTGAVPNSAPDTSQEEVEVTAPTQTAKKAGKSIATKFPRQPKPSKNSKRYKAIAEASRLKVRKRFKRQHAVEEARRVEAEVMAEKADLAAIFDNNDAILEFQSYVLSQGSQNFVAL
ncbi:Protein FAR-RED IMPAIRED RESPONSE 1 [Linum grandiflorum]